MARPMKGGEGDIYEALRNSEYFFFHVFLCRVFLMFPVGCYRLLLTYLEISLFGSWHIARSV